MRDFHRLQVWQKAHELVLRVYGATRAFPKEEMYGLTSQMRRAAASIPANIAEGCGRNGIAELARFCDLAAGSASELEYHLLLARDLSLLAEADYETLVAQVQEVKRMLTGYTQALRSG
jgi:four helix bundle protein